jgi:hypothetical protein
MNQQFLNKEINIIVSSDEQQGASNKSSDGSSFDVVMSQPLSLPKNALNAYLAVEESTVWWVIPNFISNVNNKMYFNLPTEANSTVYNNYVVSIPTGLYDLTAFNNAIQIQLINQGAKNTPSKSVNISGDLSTQLMQITFNYINCSCTFGLHSPYQILGVDSNKIFSNGLISPLTLSGQYPVKFNTIDYFLLNSDLPDTGLQFNGSYYNSICQILIDVKVGNQIRNKPFNPAKLSCDKLIGAQRSRFRVWLTDNSNNPVNTNGEYFTARLVIRYQVPL